MGIAIVTEVAYLWAAQRAGSGRSCGLARTPSRLNTLEEALVLGDEVLVGQTVLEKLDLLADCANGRVLPNPAIPTNPSRRSSSFSSGIPGTMPHVIHFEIHTNDPERAIRFYKELLGWEFTSWAGPDAVLAGDDRPRRHAGDQWRADEAAASDQRQRRGNRLRLHGRRR